MISAGSRRCRCCATPRGWWRWRTRSGPELEEGFIGRLAQAESNARTIGSGRDIYLQRARPHLPPPVRIAAGLAAARALAPEAARSPAWELEGPDSAVTVTDRRTGRRDTLSLTLARRGVELDVLVRSAPDGPPIELSLADLPERQRAAIETVLRGEALERLLTPEEHRRLDQGEELRPLIRHALLRHVRGLADDRDERARDDVLDLLRILEQLGQAVPFDAQTAFYRIWKTRAADDGDMARLAHRLGFATS